MNKFRICTVVTGNSINEFLLNLENIQKVSDFIELRADFISNLKVNDLDIIKENTYRTAIFTCRKKSEGGNFNGSEEKRMNILRKANVLSFDFLDIEFSSFNKL